MSAANFPKGIFEAITHLPNLTEIPGNPVAPSVPESNPHFAPTDPCVPVIDALFHPVTTLPTDHGWIV